MTFIFLWIFFFNEVYGLEILKEEPVALSGAHGMALTSEGSLLLSDTFRSRGTGWSWVFESTSQGWVQRDVRGVGMAGLEKIEGGYLACDVQGSKVFELDEDLRKVREWSVPSPWNEKRSAEGRIFVVSFQNKVFELMDEGPPLTVISDLDAPFDLEFSQSPNELWISEQGVAEGRVSLWKLGETAERVLVSDYPWDNPEGMVLKAPNASKKMRGTYFPVCSAL